MNYRERRIAFVTLLVAPIWGPASLPIAGTDAASPQLAAATAPAGHFKSFRIPTDNSEPRDITLGSDGNMWFTESNNNVSQIGRIDAAGSVTEFVVPTRFSTPSDIVSGSDGALWFTAQTGFPDFFIGRVTTAGAFTGFPPACDPTIGCSIVPQGIASGPDGNIWFTERLRNAIVKLTPLGDFTFHTIPTPDANPSGIALGPDGALWFAEFNTNSIGRIDVFGNITEFAGVIGSPDRITAGPDGNLWFTEPFSFDNRIGRITPFGAITEFSLTSPAGPRDIAAGPDGNLWFTEFDGELLSQITPDGVITDVARVRGGPWGIGRSADGSMWVTQITSNKVGRFTLR